MAITCDRCGRQYDVTLFQFGRTISCACGARVGFEHKVDLGARREAKFFADVNVARLVRWLRAAGFDTVWEDRIADDELVRRAIEERRWVVTLDKRLAEEFRADNVLLLASEEALAQLAEVVARLALEKPAALFTRCLVCNALLRSAAPEKIEGKIPPSVRENPPSVSYCPNCDKLYWEGSHTRRMRAALETIFAR